MTELPTIKEYKRNEKHFDWSIFTRKNVIEVESDLEDDD